MWNRSAHPSGDFLPSINPFLSNFSDIMPRTTLFCGVPANAAATCKYHTLEDTLAALLIIGMAFGAVAAAISVGLFGAGLFAGFLIYSFGGAAATLAAAWVRFKCAERRDGDGKDKGSMIHRALV